MVTTQGCCVLFWTNPRSSTLKKSSFVATYFLSPKPSTPNGLDMLGTAEEITWLSSMDSIKWTQQCWPYSKTCICQLYTDAECSYKDLSTIMIIRNDDKKVKGTRAVNTFDDGEYHSTFKVIFLIIWVLFLISKFKEKYTNVLTSQIAP